MIVRVLRPAVTSQPTITPGTTPEDPPANVNELMMDAADANAIEVRVNVCLRQGMTLMSVCIQGREKVHVIRSHPLIK